MDSENFNQTSENKKKKEAHLWKRDPHDWYVEPSECSRALFKHENFQGPIWDPACGLGRIVSQAKHCGLDAFGSDIIKRSEICSFNADFFSENDIPPFSSIVTNPPFGRAEDFIRRAISLVPVGGKVAALLPIVWLSGFSSKRDWLPLSPLRKVYPISPRPSMPPGRVIEAGIRPGNGTKDFCWLVWEIGYSGKSEVEFLNTKDHKKDIELEMFWGKHESITQRKSFG